MKGDGGVRARAESSGLLRLLSKMSRVGKWKREEGAEVINRKKARERMKEEDEREDVRC